MFAGRRLRVSLRRGSSGNTYDPIAGAQTDTITINREPINVTDKDDGGIQALLAEQGTYAIELSVEGVLEDETLMNLVSDASPNTPALSNLRISIANLGNFTGDFFINSFSLTGAEGAEAITFSATFMSSGEVPYTT